MSRLYVCGIHMWCNPSHIYSMYMWNVPPWLANPTHACRPHKDTYIQSAPEKCDCCSYGQVDAEPRRGWSTLLTVGLLTDLYWCAAIMWMCAQYTSYNTVHICVCVVHLHNSVHIVYPFRGVCLDHSCHHAVTTKMASMAIFTFDNLVYTGCLHRVMGCSYI